MRWVTVEISQFEDEKMMMYTWAMKTTYWLEEREEKEISTRNGRPTQTYEGTLETIG